MKRKKIEEKIKKLVSFLFLSLFLFVPFFVKAADTGLVSSDCGYLVNGKLIECGYANLLTLINTIINWIITISIPISAGVFAWAGLKYMTTAVADQKSEAKAMIRKVLIGFAIILAAWIIVSTILNALLSSSFVSSMNQKTNIMPLKDVTGS